MSKIEQVLGRAIRRRRRLHASIAFAAAAVSIASTLAVRYEISGAALDGALGLAVAIGEFVFITAIIPLVVTVIYYGASAFSLHLLLIRTKEIELPEARLRRLY